MVKKIKDDKIGILDPEGKYSNPLTGNKYSETYKILAKNPKDKTDGWSTLPVYKESENLIKQIEKNRVLILESGTGSGKTVIIPKLALHALNYKGKVVATVPKSGLAKSSGDYAAATLDVGKRDENDSNIINATGKGVGYLFRGAKEMPGYANEKTNLIFATDGFIVSMLKSDPEAKKFDIIIIDEAHERGKNIDIILYLLRNALRLNPKLKVITMSATLPEGLFQRYFIEFDPKTIELPKAPLFHVEDIFLKKPFPPYNSQKSVQNIYDFFVNEIIKKDVKGDAIIFFPVIKGCKALAEKISSNYPDIKTYSIDAQSAKIYDDEVSSSVEDLSEKYGIKITRKVSISTKVWESSKTIKGLKIVIDDGYENNVSYDALSGVEKSGIERISKAQASQRKGRTGRKNPGVCYKLYTEREYKDFLDDPIAPILKDNLLGDIFSFMFLPAIENLSQLVELTQSLIQPIPLDVVKVYIRIIHDLNLITEFSKFGKLSQTGIEVNSIQADDLLHKKILHSSIKYNCSREMCLIVKILEEFKRGSDLTKLFNVRDSIEIFDYNKYLGKFKHKYGDLFNLYNAVKMYYNIKYMRGNNQKLRETKELLLKQYIYKYHINKYQIDRILEESVEKYYRLPRDIEHDNIDLSNDEDRLLFSLLTGYFINISQIVDPVKKKFKNFYYPKKTTFDLDKKMSLMKSRNNLNYIFYISLSSSSFGKNCVNPVDLPKKY